MSSASKAHRCSMSQYVQSPCSEQESTLQPVTQGTQIFPFKKLPKIEKKKLKLQFLAVIGEDVEDVRVKVEGHNCFDVT